MRILAFIHKENDSDFGISFPDFPGCVSAGKTVDEARLNGLEALDLHLEGMAEDGEAVDTNFKTYNQALNLPEAKDAVLILELEIGLPLKAQRINLTVREDYLATIDRAAEKEGTSRSEYMVKAAVQAARVHANH